MAVAAARVVANGYLTGSAYMYLVYIAQAQLQHLPENATDHIITVRECVKV
jgi:hypothetical protein